MTVERLISVLQPLPDPCLLLRVGGRIEAGNAAAIRLLGASRLVGRPALPDLVDQDTGSVQNYLRMWARSGSPLPGALQLILPDGSRARYRCYGATVVPGPEPLLLVRLLPREAASQQFLVLNERIARLNREIQERRQAQAQLQEQALQLEQLATELEQTVEELQHQTEGATEAQQKAEHAAERFRALADAGAALAASLDYRDTVHELTAAAVRTIADYCIAYTLDQDGQLRRVAGSHADPALQPLVDSLVADYPTDTTTRGVASIVASGQPVLAERISEEMLQHASADAEHLHLLRRLAPTSSIVTPLMARGRTIGAVAVARSGYRAPYTQEDLGLVQELARRAGLALDNARLFDEAQRANRAKSAFLATMSHELRTPLNAIVGYTDLLDAEVSGPLVPGQREQLMRIRSAADHLRTIIEEILAFARIEAGKEQVRLEQVELSSLVRETTELVRPALQLRELTLDMCADELLEVITDSGKLKQIVLNLLGNAVKFTIRGRISVLVEAVPDGARVVVSDTGIGIPPDDLGRIFDPFWQVDHGTTRHAGGTGLGLTVSRRLAQLLGGDIDVASEPGAGSTFTLRLPLTPISDVPPAGPAPGGASAHA